MGYWETVRTLAALYEGMTEEKVISKVETNYFVVHKEGIKETLRNTNQSVETAGHWADMAPHALVVFARDIIEVRDE